jgi:hypothetical protein
MRILEDQKGVGVGARDDEGQELGKKRKPRTATIHEEAFSSWWVITNKVKRYVQNGTERFSKILPCYFTYISRSDVHILKILHRMLRKHSQHRCDGRNYYFS